MSPGGCAGVLVTESEVDTAFKFFDATKGKAVDYETVKVRAGGASHCSSRRRRGGGSRRRGGGAAAAMWLRDHVQRGLGGTRTAGFGLAQSQLTLRWWRVVVLRKNSAFSRTTAACPRTSRP